MARPGASLRLPLPTPADTERNLPASGVSTSKAWHPGPAVATSGRALVKKGFFLPAADVAEVFLAWVGDRDLAGEWPVDEVWRLAHEEFGPALHLVMPSRQTFLAALKRQPGVLVMHDRRVRDREGRVLCKTTFYALPAPLATELVTAA